VTTADWAAWHAAYDDPATPLSSRLAVVQARLGDVLDALGATGSPVRLVAMCAGEGRDVLPVLAARPHQPVDAVLVELDADLAARARAGAAPSTEVRMADAGDPASYAGALPAQVVLACGVFGNITDGDVAATIRFLAAATTPGGFVVWTRHRQAPDLTPAIRAWWAEAGFAEAVFDAPPDTWWSVGVHRRGDETVEPWPTDRRIFTFVR